MKTTLLSLALLAAGSAFAACPAELQAQSARYKAAIGEALIMSEGDTTWEAFCSDAPVDASLTPDVLVAALGGTFESADTQAEILELFDFYIQQNPYESAAEAQQYANLKQALLADFTELRAVKLFDEESGTMRYYVFGRTADGYLVGVKTELVET